MADATVITAVTLVATRSHLAWDVFSRAGDLTSSVTLARLPIVVVWLASLLVSGAYSSPVFGAGAAEYRSVLRASLYAAGSVGIVCYLTSFPLPHSYFVMLFAVGVPVLLVSRYACRKVLHVVRRNGHLQQTVLIAGGPAQVDEIAGVLRRESWLGYTVVGALLPDGDTSSETPRGLQVLGETRQLAQVVAAQRPHAVLFATGAVCSAQQMRRAVWDLDETGVQILLAPSLTDVASDRIRSRPAAGLPLIELEGASVHEGSHLLKRAFDVVVGGLLTVLFAPLIAAVAIAIKLDDGGPVFFSQQRVGRNGTHFGLLKFRSMVVDAEALARSVVDQNRHGDDHVLFKAEHDPRVTRVGRTLRRFSLDELPQLLNVVRGEMSLVGPRPPLQSEVDRYEQDVHRRFVVRPGMTGLWQVSGRSNLSWEDSVRLDLYYVDNWSLTQDLLILARTASAVVSARGAY